MRGVGNVVPVGLVQMSCTHCPSENYRRAISLIEEGAERGAKVICTPELFKSLYFCQVADPDQLRLAEVLDPQNETVAELSALARNLEVVIISSLFEKRAPGFYHNAAVVIDADGAVLGKYRKMHIPEDPHYLEKFYFAPGDLGYPVFETRYGILGVLICWDQWFPEAARLMALNGAEIIFYPTAIGYSPGEDEQTQLAWQVVQRGHAVANCCYVAAVNRVGFEAHPASEGGLDFWGRSFVADPLGRVVAEASNDEEEVLICPVDWSLFERTRDVLGHFFRDRRIDSDSGLTKRYGNLR